MPLDQPAVASDIATIAPPSTEVGALALTTMKPEDYAAAVFKPFNDKLAVECAAADLIVFSEAQLLALPEDARKLAQVVDITTTAGMAVAVKYRAIFRDDIRLDSKEAFEVRKAPVLHIGRLLDAGKKKIADAVAPYEAKFNDAIKAEEDRKFEVKAEKERAEAARVAAIRVQIDAIRGLPAINAGSGAAQLFEVLALLAKREIMEAEFFELTASARGAVELAALELQTMYTAAAEREAAALAAEQARIAEIARIEAARVEHERLAAIERAALAAQRAENERVANEQAAERQRLADQQAAQDRDARERAEKAAANLKAEQDALAEQVRRTNEAQAEAAAKVEAAQAALEAQKAEFAAAVKMDADHAEAMIDNATFDDAMTRLAAVDTPTFTEPSSDLARCTATAQAMLTNGRSLVQAGASLAAYVDAGLADADDPSDEEIIEQVAESFGMTFAEALARVSTIAFAELRAELVAA
jgi:hypothetical protein